MTSAECYSCSASLEEDDRPEVLEPETSRFDEFAARAKACHSGELSREDFGQWVKETQKLMQRKREEYVELVREGEFEDVDFEGVQTLDCLANLEYHRTGYFDEREDEVSTAMEGMLEMEAAMEQMLEFAKNEQVEDSILVAALEQLWEGNLKCNQAIQMNREFKEQLLQSAS